jgi:hypothetical protein
VNGGTSRAGHQSILLDITMHNVTLLKFDDLLLVMRDQSSSDFAS